jgi:hypothetical protein
MLQASMISTCNVLIMASLPVHASSSHFIVDHTLTSHVGATQPQLWLICTPQSVGLVKAQLTACSVEPAVQTNSNNSSRCLAALQMLGKPSEMAGRSLLLLLF